MPSSSTGMGLWPAWLSSRCPASRSSLACIHVSGNQKGNERVPSTFRFRKFPGNQRVFGAPFWQLSSFPESESWSGAKSEAKPRNSAKYPASRSQGNFQVCPGILPLWLILGPNQLISTEFPRETREETRGCCRETRKGNETGCARKHGYSLNCGAGIETR